jgi:hypothetical protein
MFNEEPVGFYIDLFCCVERFYMHRPFHRRFFVVFSSLKTNLRRWMEFVQAESLKTDGLNRHSDAD